MDRWLRPTGFLDFEHPGVQRFVTDHRGDRGDPVSMGVALFYGVRDGIRYDYRCIDLDPRTLVASAVVEAGRSFCVGKAAVLAAACRAVAIPCRLGFADVRNHLAPDHLIELMGTDLFVFHGYVEMYLEGRWVKATPAFDGALCDRFGVRPIEFDGVHDALFHEFDLKDDRHMQYVNDRGVFDDLPHGLMVEAIRDAYPSIFGEQDVHPQVDRAKLGEMEPGSRDPVE